MNFTFTSDTKLQSDDPRRVAVHDAGHAIIAVKLGILFDHVKLGPGPEDGEVPPTFSPFDKESRPAPDDIPKWRSFYAGGAAAEHIAFDSIRSHAIRCDAKRHDGLKRFSNEDGLVD